MKRFEGKTVVVTGGNKGIGFAIARRFAEEGANLVIASFEPQVEDAAAALREMGGQAIGVVSQTDMVLARQGRTQEQARTMLAKDVMTPGCATCDADMLLSEAVSLMTSRRMHRLVVTMKGHVAGVISLTDVVHKLIG